MSEIPFRRLGPWFAGVAVSVNRALYTLFIDTGGSTTRLLPSLRHEAGIAVAASGRARDAFGEHDVEKGVIESFAIAGHEIRGLQVLLLDESDVYAAAEERVVGFLCHDVLDRFCATFDLPKGVLTLEPPGTLPAGSAVACLCDDAGWFVKAGCGDHEIRLQLDTGAGMSCLRQSSPVSPTLEMTELVVRTSAPTGTLDCPVGRMPELRIGDLPLPGVEFAVGEFDLDDAAGDFVDGLLGLDALGGLRWTVDRESQAARFGAGQLPPS